MKQRITFEQLQDLTESQKSRLRDWWLPTQGDFFHTGNGCRIEVVSQYLQPDDDDLPILSIGQMIQLLHEKGRFREVAYTFEPDFRDDTSTTPVEEWHVFTTTVGSVVGPDLCDTLWAAVCDKI